jgi:predicted Zn-dependent protease with MMP-like domain
VSDLSTPEEIRAEAVDRVARRVAENSGRVTPNHIDHFQAGELVDALGDLLPTAMEGRYIGRGLLRRTRYVTDWREPEVTE